MTFTGAPSLEPAALGAREMCSNLEPSLAVPGTKVYGGSETLGPLMLRFPRKPAPPHWRLSNSHAPSFRFVASRHRPRRVRRARGGGEVVASGLPRPSTAWRSARSAYVRRSDRRLGALDALASRRGAEDAAVPAGPRAVFDGSAANGEGDAASRARWRMSRCARRTCVRFRLRSFSA